MDIIQFTTEDKAHKPYTITVSGEPPTNDSKSKVSLKYSIQGKDHTVALDVGFDTVLGELTASGLAIPKLLDDPYLICLAKCGLSHLVDEVLDCWKNGARTPKKLWKCLQNKGAKIGLGIAGCALKCAAGI